MVAYLVSKSEGLTDLQKSFGMNQTQITLHVGR
jgi:hypothetical protein